MAISQESMPGRGMYHGNMIGNSQSGLSWPVLKQKVDAAAQRTLEQKKGHSKGLELPGGSVAWNPADQTLDIIVGSRQDSQS